MKLELKMHIDHTVTCFGMWRQTQISDAANPERTLHDPLLTPHIQHEEGICTLSNSS